MNEEEIKTILSSIPFDTRKGNKQFSRQDKETIRKLYKQITGKTIGNTNCSNCISDAYIYLKLQTNQKLKQMSDSQFKLPDGKQLKMHGYAHVLTNANLTDEKALEVLKLNRGLIKCFSSFPANWQELLGYVAVKTSKKKAVENDEPTRKELIAQNETHLKGLSKTELTAMAESNELDADEYSDKSKKELVDYLMKKVCIPSIDAELNKEE